MYENVTYLVAKFGLKTFQLTRIDLNYNKLINLSAPELFFKF